MKGVLIDTNIIIDLLRSYRSSRPKNDEYSFNSLKSYELFEKLIESRIIRYVSCHTIKELLQYPSISPQEEERVHNVLPDLTSILPTTKEVAETAGILARQSVEYRGDHIEDCYIAAAAITYNLPLYTRNPDDFKYVDHNWLKIVVPYNFHGQTSI